MADRRQARKKGGEPTPAQARWKAIRDDLAYMAPEESLAMGLWNAYHACGDAAKEEDLKIIVALWKAESASGRRKWLLVATEALVYMGRTGG